MFRTHEPIEGLLLQQAPPENVDQATDPGLTPLPPLASIPNRLHVCWYSHATFVARKNSGKTNQQASIFCRTERKQGRIITLPAENQGTHLVSVGDGPDLHVEVELCAENLRLIHKHAQKTGPNGAGADQPHTNRLPQKKRRQAGRVISDTCIYEGNRGAKTRRRNKKTGVRIAVTTRALKMRHSTLMLVVHVVRWLWHTQNQE